MSAVRTPSTSWPVCSRQMAAASSPERGASGTSAVFWIIRPSRSEATTSSAGVSGSAGSTSHSRSDADACAPSPIRPSFAVMTAIAPGIPPDVRSSAELRNSAR